MTVYSMAVSFYMQSGEKLRNSQIGRSNNCALWILKNNFLRLRKVLEIFFGKECEPSCEKDRGFEYDQVGMFLNTLLHMPVEIKGGWYSPI